MTPDERAALEEERTFLLSSLADLEREREAGDVDDADYAALKDSYTARAADVIRRLRDTDAPKKSGRASSPWRMVIGSLVVLAVAISAGILVARNAGERLPGQTMTGSIGDGSVSSLLVQARSIGMQEIPTALDLYSQVLAVEPDNVEALTYFGWLTIISATQDTESSDEQVRDRFQSGLVLLRQATIADPEYPDAHCFLGIAFFRFLQDAEAAQGEVDQCLSSNPPAEVAALVKNLSGDIDAALASSTTSQP
jgi:tetratricopeptide (TPR) repeat protein